LPVYQGTLNMGMFNTNSVSKPLSSRHPPNNVMTKIHRNTFFHTSTFVLV